VSLAEISINILIFLLITYKVEAYFDYHASLMMICSVYVGSLLHSVYKIIRNFDVLLILIRDYRLNIKRYIFGQIYAKARSEAQEKFKGMGVIKRLVYRVSAGPGADTVAMRVANGAMPLIWKRVSARLFAVLMTVVIYILIFRLVVAPFLIQETAHFSPIQAFLWPFAFSIDYFFHTHLSGWVLSFT
jgi:hypothetical protein